MADTIKIKNKTYTIDLDAPIDISIPMRFNGPQPNAYGVEAAISEPVRAGDLVGDTTLGGSVNFEQYTFIAHCNGTHTECVGHITNESITIRDCLKDVLIPAVLVSVEPEQDGNDFIISREVLMSKTKAVAAVRATGTALIVRTLPNDYTKLTRQYNSDNIPPYFEIEAMDLIVERGFKHLLVDLPSIDRLFDDGMVLNHRKFWNVEPGRFEIYADSRIYNTITELIYVPNGIQDGEYLLNLQIAPFESDAAPSRPILFKSI